MFLLHQKETTWKLVSVPGQETGLIALQHNELSYFHQSVKETS